jgi:hypothetical protein
MKNTLKPSGRAGKRLPRSAGTVKHPSERAEILAYLKSVGARPITRAERARLKKASLLGMPSE